MKGKRGSVLVSNGKTGEVLSYVSSPSLSPVLFTSGPTNDEWNDTEDWILFLGNKYYRN